MDLYQQATWRQLMHSTHPKKLNLHVLECYHCEYELDETVTYCPDCEL
jgi:hypothetical protein